MASSQQTSHTKSTISGSCKLQSLDDPTTLFSVLHQAQAADCRNFLIAFDDATALVQTNSSDTSLQHTLERSDSSVLTTRWLCIFKPSAHKQILESLARQYDFAPRLLAEMTSQPARQSVTDDLSVQSSALPHPSSVHSSDYLYKPASNYSIDSNGLERMSTSYASTQLERKNIYSLASEIWHYTTIDFGRNYICCGYNTLYTVSHRSVADTSTEYHLPSCIRVWTWLLITDDGLVITVTEDVLQKAGYLSSDAASQLIATTRRDMLNVLRSLSTVGNDPLHASNRLALLPIRSRLGSTPEEELHRDADAPGLLFFYLFESWHNSYSLITRRESRYGRELETLRKQMLVRPRLGHIDRLHRIGQELGVLKRHYSSYNSIIERLLEPRPLTATSLQTSLVAEGLGVQTKSAPLAMTKESTVGVSFSTAARVRFQRLHDQINLYALSEIDEYLAQKDSLVSLNFNLLTLRESLDVERLTRITLLLTKATILFLPVSFMASYFGIQLAGMSYTVLQFWVSFAGVFLVSLAMLFAFGILSGTAQTASTLNAIGRGMRAVFTCSTLRKHGSEVV